MKLSSLILSIQLDYQSSSVFLIYVELFLLIVGSNLSGITFW